jgi:hypothetical protein
MSVTIMNFVTPKVGAKHELLFKNRPLDDGEKKFFKTFNYSQERQAVILHLLNSLRDQFYKTFYGRKLRIFVIS